MTGDAVYVQGNACHLPLPGNSIDACVLDPPYALPGGFMGHEWDRFGRGRTGAPGLGDRPTPWISHEGWNEFRCRSCGRLSHGGTPCTCPAPQFGRVNNRWHHYQAWCEQWAAECLRVLKPGGHLAAFGATRTYHRLACAIEDAGFEIRDSLHWVYGSGFPKSHDVSKAIDKASGAEREVLRERSYSLRNDGGYRGGLNTTRPRSESCEITAPATADAARWEGWGTALKPAHEPIVLARKPLAGTVSGNVLEHGTGALNIDGCRVGAGQDYRDKCASVVGLGSNRNGDTYSEWTGTREDSASDAGRWPPNFLLSHGPGCMQTGVRRAAGEKRAGQPPGRRPGGFGDVGAAVGGGGPNGVLHGDQIVPVYQCAAGCPVAELDRQSGMSTSAGGVNGGKLGVRVYGAFANEVIGQNAGGLGDTGGASRFFPVFKYEAKAPATERPRGVDGTVHSTVKPVGLIRWLVRLITPPGGTVLDCFAGSGTTGEACIVEGFRCVLVEKHAPYLGLIRQRLGKPIQPDLFGDAG